MVFHWAIKFFLEKCLELVSFYVTGYIQILYWEKCMIHTKD